MWIRKRWQQFRVEIVGVPYPMKTLRPLKHTHMRQSLGDCLLLSSLLQHPFDFFFNPRALSLTSKWLSQALSITLRAHACSGLFIRLYLLWSVCVGYRQAVQLQSDWITAVSAVESTVTECALVIRFLFITSAQIEHVSFHTFVAFTARLLNVMVSHNMWRTWVTQHYVSYCHYQKILFFLVVFMWLFLLSHTEGEA